MTSKPYYRKKDRIQTTLTPKVIMQLDVFLDLKYLIQNNNDEILLLGTVTCTNSDKNIIYKITKLYIPPQTDISSAFVTTDDEKFGEWFQQIPREERLTMKMHFHSHPKMSVSPSPTDISTIEEKIENIDDFYIRIIGNQDLNFHIDIYDIENHMTHTDLPLIVITEGLIINFTTKHINILTAHTNPELQAELKKQTAPKRTTYFNYGYGSPSYYKSPFFKDINDPNDETNYDKITSSAFLPNPKTKKKKKETKKPKTITTIPQNFEAHLIEVFDNITTGDLATKYLEETLEEIQTENKLPYRAILSIIFDDDIAYYNTFLAYTLEEVLELMEPDIDTEETKKR